MLANKDLKMNIALKLEDKYRKYLEYTRIELRDDYDSAVDQYEEALREEFVNLSPNDRTELFCSLLKNTREELEDCFAENHTGRAIELMLLEQLLIQVVGTNEK